MSLLFPARIDDGDEVDDWDVTNPRTGERVPLRADRWYQSAPNQDPITTSGDFAGIRINIWNRAKVRRFITHSLAGGGSHNLGFHALRWEMILHGNAGLPLVPVGATGTIPFAMRRESACFPGAFCDKSENSGDGCRWWFVNSWALGWGTKQ